MRALLPARMPRCLCCERSPRCRTLAAAESLEDLIGHSASQSRSANSWLFRTRRAGGAQLKGEDRAKRRQRDKLPVVIITIVTNTSSEPR